MSIKTSHWECPSNIAIVKYWGKKELQVPCNPSISITLSSAVTRSRLEAIPKQGTFPEITVYWNGEENPTLAKKLTGFLLSIQKYIPEVTKFSLTLYTQNTFPHGAGIASSASGMGALALCLCELFRPEAEKGTHQNDFLQMASQIARLGSGSASRSIFKGFALWGKTPSWQNSSNEYASPLNSMVHNTFNEMQNCILIVDPSEKKVSSTAGHGLMKNHPYATSRFIQAEQHTEEMIEVLQNGNMERFIEITESEALALHAMMMTSNPGYLLIKPTTLDVIENIRTFRQQSGLPICFTLDAGPNVHILYPKSVENQIKEFIIHYLCPKFPMASPLWDHAGNGPKSLK
jgi:diphosphomevalonate decarboxylase